MFKQSFSLKTKYLFQKNASLIFTFFCFLSLLISCGKKELKQVYYFKPNQLNQLLDTCEIICEKSNGYQSLIYLDQQISGKNLNWEELFWVNNFKIKKFYYDLKKFDSVAFYIQKNLRSLNGKKLNEKTKKMYATAYYTLAQFNFSNHSYKEALKNYKLSFYYLDDTKDTFNIAYYHFRLGMLFYREQSFEESTNEFIVSLNYFKSIKRNFDLNYKVQEIIDNIGLSYHQRKMYDSAIHYFESAYKFIDSNRLNYTNHMIAWEIARAVIHENLGTTLEKINKPQIAFQHYQIAKNILTKYNYNKEIILNLDLKILDLSIRQSKFVTNEINQLFNEIKSAENQRFNDEGINEKIHLIKCNYYELCKKYDSAFYYVKLYGILKEKNKDLLFDAQNNNLKEQLHDLKHQEELTKLERKINKYLLPLVVVSILVIVLFFVIVNKNKVTKKLNENAAHIMVINRKLIEKKDIQYQLIKQLETSQREKDILLRGVVHDLITPLSSVIINTEFFEMKNKSVFNNTSFFKETLFTLNEMVSTCQDLLEFVTTKKLALKLKENNLTTIIKSSMQDLEGKLLKKNQRINFQTNGNELLSLRIDENKIKRVIINLLTNAIKFSNFNASIHVSLEKTKEEIVVKIKDEGIGMSKEIIENNYGKPIMQGQKGTDGEQSFGLGLFISKQIIEAHHGKLIIESELGVGTLISVHLPLTQTRH